MYKHNKVATWLYNLCDRFSKFLYKHRWLYYILALTWGGLLTYSGFIVLFILFIYKKINNDCEINKYNGILQVKINDYWGGCSLGLIYLRDFESSDSINEHEFGHTFQNCLLGPLFIFLIAIPSVIRYWFSGKLNKPYDAVWFEDSATQIGRKLIEKDD